MNQEHRSIARLPTELLAEVRWEDQAGSDEAAEARSSDVSEVFSTMPDCPGLETPITFSVFFPAEITGTSIELVGRGLVIRHSQVGKLAGIAAVIDAYELRTSVPDA